MEFYELYTIPREDNPNESYGCYLEHDILNSTLMQESPKALFELLERFDSKLGDCYKKTFAFYNLLERTFNKSLTSSNSVRESNACKPIQWLTTYFGQDVTLYVEHLVANLYVIVTSSGYVTVKSLTGFRGHCIEKSYSDKDTFYNALCKECGNDYAKEFLRVFDNLVSVIRSDEKFIREAARLSILFVGNYTLQDFSAYFQGVEFIVNKMRKTADVLWLDYIPRLPEDMVAVNPCTDRKVKDFNYSYNEALVVLAQCLPMLYLVRYQYVDEQLICYSVKPGLRQVIEVVIGFTEDCYLRNKEYLDERIAKDSELFIRGCPKALSIDNYLNMSMDERAEVY